MLWLICVRRRPPRSSTHNSGSRRPFDTLTGAFWGVIVDLVDVDVVDVVDVDIVDVDLDVDLVDVDLEVDLVDADLVDVVFLSSSCILSFCPPAVPAVFSPGCIWGIPVQLVCMPYVIGCRL